MTIQSINRGKEEKGGCAELSANSASPFSAVNILPSALATDTSDFAVKTSIRYEQIQSCFIYLASKTGILKKLLLLLYFTFYIFHSSFAQPDSCHLRITLITCSPGEELYSSFGHTALRVQDQTAGTDLFFNYGTFEFNDEFYIKFVRGKLNYFLSVQTPDEFMYQYEMEGRGVYEQELQLSCSEKEKLFAALLVNAREENKYYRYDFLFDNCTTRAGVIVEKNSNGQVVYKNILPTNPPSFRDLIHEYLDQGHKHWSKLGIDILLGAKLDRNSTNNEAIHFLPDYLLKGFDSAAVKTVPLVSAKRTILERPSFKTSPNGFKWDISIVPPAIIFGILFLIGVLLSLGRTKRLKLAMSIFDFLFFFLLGLAGLLLLFMWFGTDHTVCQNNYNLLWALPIHVVMAFFVHSQKLWVKKYFRVVFWLSLLLALCWFFLPQEMNNALIPVLLLIMFRSWQLSKINYYGRERNTP